MLDHERPGSLEEKIEDLNTEVERLKNEGKPLTPEQQEDIQESIFAAIKGLKLDEQAIRIYLAKADISNILREYFVGILTLLLTIFGVILGVSGLGAFRLLKGRIERRAEQLEEEIKDKIQVEATDQGNVIVARILKIVGYTHWRVYEEKKDDADLRIAIESARRALQHASQIQDKEKYETEIADAKNNLAYFWLEQKELDDSEKSTIWRYAKDILEISRKEKHQGGNDWYDWRDTYVWVLLILESDSDEQEKGREMFQELMGHRGVPREWREKTLQRYRCRKELERFEWVTQRYPFENE